MKNRLLVFILMIFTIISIGNTISFIFFYMLLAFLIMSISCSNFSNIDNCQYFYLTNNNNEYLNIFLLNSNDVYGKIYYLDINNNKIEYNIDKINRLNGYLTAKTSDGKILKGFLPNKTDGFDGIINKHKVSFNYPNLYSKDINIIEYSYKNDLFKSTINYKIYLFLLNNPNNIKAIDIINADINKKYGIKECTNINNKKELFRLIDSELNKKIKYIFSNHDNINKEKIYNVADSLPAITFLNNDIISISSDKIINDAVYSLKDGKKLNITDIIEDADRCIMIIKEQILKNKLENESFDINNFNLDNNYFYLTPNGIVFNWVIEYEDYFVNEYIKYFTIFVNGKDIIDIIKDDHKKIFNIQ